MSVRDFHGMTVVARLEAIRGNQEVTMAPQNALSATVSAAEPAAVGTPNSVADASRHPILERARSVSAGEHPGYAGTVTPREAMDLVGAGLARLVDVRTPEERKFVGYVPDSLHVAWMTGTSMTRNPRFVRELEGKARKNEVLLFLCRSGQRSAAAAEAATRAQFQHAFNVAEGFEGELDERKQRGNKSGWRLSGLPWVQD
jgi:rhodanese-related sulfurtransferase